MQRRINLKPYDWLLQDWNAFLTMSTCHELLEIDHKKTELSHEPGTSEIGSLVLFANL
jgi:hypothetical protein